MQSNVLDLEMGGELRRRIPHQPTFLNPTSPSQAAHAYPNEALPPVPPHRVQAVRFDLPRGPDRAAEAAEYRQRTFLLLQTLIPVCAMLASVGATLFAVSFFTTANGTMAKIPEVGKYALGASVLLSVQAHILAHVLNLRAMLDDPSRTGIKRMRRSLALIHQWMIRVVVIFTTISAVSLVAGVCLWMGADPGTTGGVIWTVFLLAAILLSTFLAAAFLAFSFDFLP